jgi:hypothetical protein
LVVIAVTGVLMVSHNCTSWVVVFRLCKQNYNFSHTGDSNVNLLSD